MTPVNEALRQDMLAKGIDIDLTLSILNDFNNGLYDNLKPVKAVSVPKIDGSTVIDTRLFSPGRAGVYRIDRDTALRALADAGTPMPPAVIPEKTAEGKDILAFPTEALLDIGYSLLPKTAFGVLNGGSATSYADTKKNKALGDQVFSILEAKFHEMAPSCKDVPKGITPAYTNPDGSPGYSFLELKMRARLILAMRYAKRMSVSTVNERQGKEFLPLFQMSSSLNDGQLKAHYDAVKNSPLLAGLAKKTGLEPAQWHTGIQPMIAAYSHSSCGRPKTIFDTAWGKPNSALPLPGGHGQFFRILAPVLKAFHAQGIRFACLGNVDNIGYMPDPVELAMLLLSGKSAAFDFSFRTELDVKGGILVETESGSRTIADIGPAISAEEVAQLEQAGYSILFNCASGIFDLDYLVPRIDQLARELPVRFSDQDKDAGKYSQAEQVTWEITSLLPSFLAFAVEKSERFLAAKLLAENLLTSGIGLGDPGMPPSIRATSEKLNAGLNRLLTERYGLALKNGKYLPDLPA